MLKLYFMASRCPSRLLSVVSEDGARQDRQLLKDSFSVIHVCKGVLRNLSAVPCAFHTAGSSLPDFHSMEKMKHTVMCWLCKILAKRDDFHSFSGFRNLRFMAFPCSLFFPQSCPFPLMCLSFPINVRNNIYEE